MKVWSEERLASRARRLRRQAAYLQQKQASFTRRLRSCDHTDILDPDFQEMFV